MYYININAFVFFICPLLGPHWHGLMWWFHWHDGTDLKIRDGDDRMIPKIKNKYFLLPVSLSKAVVRVRFNGAQDTRVLFLRQIPNIQYRENTQTYFKWSKFCTLVLVMPCSSISRAHFVLNLLTTSQMTNHHHAMHVDMTYSRHLSKSKTK